LRDIKFQVYLFLRKEWDLGLCNPGRKVREGNNALGTKKPPASWPPGHVYEIDLFWKWGKSHLINDIWVYIVLGRRAGTLEAANGD
jgi:hypothetical protein